MKTFKIGDTVTWSGDTVTHLIKLPEKFGIGPFRVLSIETVPLDQCSCGIPLDHDGYDFCLSGMIFDRTNTQTKRESVGHDQWLWLDMPEGPTKLSAAHIAHA